MVTDNLKQIDIFEDAIYRARGNTIVTSIEPEMIISIVQCGFVVYYLS